MHTLMRYHRLITKKKSGEFGIRFPLPVKIYLGVQEDHIFSGVQSLRFRSDYKFLSDLKEDFSHNRTRYTSIQITKIIYDDYCVSPKPAPAHIGQRFMEQTISAGPTNFYDPLGTFDGMDPSSQAPCSCDFLSEMAQNALNGALPPSSDDIGQTSYSSLTIIDPSSGNLQHPITVLVIHMKIVEPQPKTTLQMLTGGDAANPSHIGDDKQVTIQQIHKGAKAHYIKHEENSSITGFITEENGLVIGRHFTETITREGRENVLHGQYREYEKQLDDSLKLRNSLFFENGSPSNDPSLTIATDPLHEIIKRANSYDRDVVKDYFTEHPVLYRDKNAEDNLSKWYTFS